VEGLKWGMNAGMGVIWRTGERRVGEATATACETFVCVALVGAFHPIATERIDFVSITRLPSSTPTSFRYVDFHPLRSYRADKNQRTSSLSSRSCFLLFTRS
jgi:hypothetical protein